MGTEKMLAKPFVKWAGGKGQLLQTYKSYYPQNLFYGNIEKYIEPFVGSGAVLFDIMQNYPIKEAYIIDINEELMLTYEVIKKDVEKLIEYLSEKESQYLALNQEKRKEFYYKVRDEYNKTKKVMSFDNYCNKTIIRAGQFIFLNRTCFNGLFRVNKKGFFNVPVGRYKNPCICNEKNLRAVHKVLQNVQILHGDYRQCKPFIDEKTFIYFDPPYRPLSETSAFTSYNKDKFNDNDQKQLASFFDEASKLGAFVMLSNSDPKNVNEEDTFFEDLYRDYNIYSVKARRVINSKASKRGAISELVITNYDLSRESRGESEIYRAL